MDRTREKQRLEDKLRRLRMLAEEYPEGATARNIQALEAELMERLQTPSSSGVSPRT